MRWWVFAIVVAFAAARQLCGADVKELKERRQRAAAAFSDGVLLLHSATTTGFVSDGYREEAAFYYLTGLEDSPGTTLAIVGKSGESWLFVPAGESKGSEETKPGEEAARRVGIDHVVDWKEMQGFLTDQTKAGAKIYYKPEAAIMLPENLSATKNNHAPGWIQVLQKSFPTADFRPGRVKLHTLMAVESGTERHDSEIAASATVKAFVAGARAIHPGVSQREVELAVVDVCWKEARGVSFWPWAMAGANSVFPKPFESESRYDHLDSRMQSGDLVRLDVGCEWHHYQGDLGRTIPVSGHFSDEQREVWNIFVAAYQSVARGLKEGLTESDAFEIWKNELVRHRQSAKSLLAKRAIETWSERKNVPYWQIHAMNLDAGYIEGPLRAGMVIDFEPIASIGGQGYYLEDMYMIGKDGATVMTSGLPYTAEEIEAFLAQKQ